MAIDGANQLVYLKDFRGEAEKLKPSWGKTSLYSTGVPELDRYLGGGYGRQYGYEIVVIFGPTKVGKSTFALNMLKAPILAGAKVGLAVLEDDGADVFIRMTDILGQEDFNLHVLTGDRVHFMAPDAVMKPWKLEDLGSMLESWFVHRHLDIVLLDHIQFAFENAEVSRAENEFHVQRRFMQQINFLMKRTKKTMILVSHVNKDRLAKGADRIQGSQAIAGGATKLIELLPAGEGALKLQMHGSRFTATPDDSIELFRNGARLL